MSRMKLEDKGKILPPPVLSKYSEVVSKEVQNCPDIIAATHWEIWDRNQPNGADFYVGEIELGHIHLDGSIHIPSTKKISQSSVKAGLAQKFPYAVDWVQYSIEDKKSVAQATWLFKLHYDHIKGTTEEDSIQQILQYEI